MRASSRTEAITVGLKPRFPAWFKRIFDHRLSHSVDQTGNAQRTGFAIPFRNVNASCGLDSASGVAAHLLDQLVAFCCRAGELAVHPRRSFAWVVLRHSPYSGIQIRSTSQHQLHQAAYPIRLLQLARTINTTSQVPHSVRCGFPVDTVPHAWECACSDARGGSIFHKHWVPCPRFIGEDPREVGSLSCQAYACILSITPGIGFLPHPLPAGDFRFACAWPTRFRDSSGLTAFRIRTIGREGSISIPLSVCSCVNQRNDLIDRSDTFW